MKSIWITGASGGIGNALAKVYDRMGYQTVLSGRDAARLNALQSGLSHTSGTHILTFDVSNKAEVEAACREVKQLSPFPSIIVLNAGISQRALAIDTQIEVYERIMETNFMSNVRIVKHLLPDIIKNRTHIVVISSVTGKIGTPYRTAYAASKHALHGFFDSLRAELHDHRVSVTLVCPGYTHTGISVNALVGDGRPQNTLDANSAQGLRPETLAEKIYHAVRKKKSEVYIGGKEIMGIHLKRFFPSLLERIIRNVRP